VVSFLVSSKYYLIKIYEIMKKLLIIGSALVAFSAVNLMANNSDGYSKTSDVAVTDTVPKKDSTKKKDSSYALAQLNDNNAFVASLDTVPKKDSTKKDSIAFAKLDNNVSFVASLDTVPKKDTTTKRDSLFLAMR